MRVKDWESRLRQTVEIYRPKPHDWASNSCLHFGGAVVEAVTGINPFAHLLGTFHDEETAKAVILAHGTDLVSATEVFLPKIAAARARRGDLGIAIVKGQQVMVGILGQFGGAPGARCLSWIGRTRLISAFQVD